jgi:hypothetical protein
MISPRCLTEGIEPESDDRIRASAPLEDGGRPAVSSARVGGAAPVYTVLMLSIYSVTEGRGANQPMRSKLRSSWGSFTVRVRRRFNFK